MVDIDTTAGPPGDDGDEQDRLWVRIIAGGGRDAERAMEGLYRKYRLQLLEFLIHRRLDKGRAEELVQKTFIRVAYGAANFRNEAKVSSWIYQIARHLHLDHLRKLNLEDGVDDKSRG